jgi:hypothetical protein
MSAVRPRGSGGLQPPLGDAIVRDSIATLRTNNRLDDKEETTGSKLAHVLHVLAGEVYALATTVTKKEAAEKIRGDIKAVAYLIDSLLRGDTGNAQTNVLMEEMKAQVEEMSKSSKAASEALAELKQVQAAMSERVEAIPAVVEKSSNTFRNALLAQPAASAKQSPTTAIPQTEEAARIMAKYAVQDRQILVDFPKDTDADLRPNLTTTKELATKAVKATEILTTLPTEVVSVNVMNNGGVLIELATTEAVAKICGDTLTRKTFEEAFGYGAHIKLRSYPLLVMTVPTHIDPSADALLRELEEVNGVQEGSFVKMTWCKPIEQRTPGQTVAYARLMVNSRDLVNRFSTTPLRIAGHVCKARRDVQEAIRCNRCQLYGHMARDCKGKQACANCGGDHRSKECTSDKRYCVSCDKDDHTSWNRMCPAFKIECRKLDERKPHNATPFYYSPEKPWTHPVARSSRTQGGSQPPPPTHEEHAPGFWADAAPMGSGQFSGPPMSWELSEAIRLERQRQAERHERFRYKGADEPSGPSQ